MRPHRASANEVAEERRASCIVPESTHQPMHANKRQLTKGSDPAQVVTLAPHNHIKVTHRLVCWDDSLLHPTPVLLLLPRYGPVMATSNQSCKVCQGHGFHGPVRTDAPFYFRPLQFIVLRISNSFIARCAFACRPLDSRRLCSALPV